MRQYKAGVSPKTKIAADAATATTVDFIFDTILVTSFSSTFLQISTPCRANVSRRGRRDEVRPRKRAVRAGSMWCGRHPSQKQQRPLLADHQAKIAGGSPSLVQND
ncbi:hypothetical protein [Oleomonas cavernae]|uniref:hypothetical protein n=1 Tax=Oleomonas cavernae TaxID=2320859 RepID=UPI0011C42149|nr:hypothetical protein [Oleomonas cavernae]